MKSCILTIVLLASCSIHAADSTMIKIVTKDISPEVTEGSFASCPKTLYLFGDKQGRLEECPDSAMGLHMLVVYNNGDIWMANLFDNSGQHSIDPGPKIAFSAPVFATTIYGNTNDTLDNFVYGKEIAFLKAIGAKVENLSPVIQKFYFSAGGYSISYYVYIRNNFPYRAAIFKNNMLIQAIEYLEYATNLVSDKKLFEKPEGIDFKEIK
jgi:hypothetical protein